MKTDLQFANELAQKFLKVELVPEQENGYYIPNHEYYIYPKDDKFELYSVVCCHSNSRWEPDDYDEVLVGEFDTLCKAVYHCVLEDLKRNMDGFLQSLWEADMEVESEKYWKETEELLASSI